ncbi:MarR family transcriptional regulator, negative regulator of the multidrug operon emrRAB [Andreprevotia lacus DSM 23236]|jgi:MarR family transcriptional repressor of emrRAB|uniref:MarR family transcriptional regulator, negative regulator of the multidrug operon emrRAB n=1 Tax=Andreprevotia lacus DSM 23236 TaxID=1121001 RepID=A0A1W1XUG1_9NEIS|nr:MarR family transcriptional regulator [Andreprevotia lacus]SMC27527.1 MarR family transcriptional regulator, negative regulator of the multidrug operon emrRAB [Andreprevotia lacus DSM 23236]
MNKHYITPASFKSTEDKIDQVCQRMQDPEADATRQNVLLTHLIKHVYAGLHARMTDALREHDLNPVSFTALMMLFSQCHSTLNPSQLAEATGESRANVTRICDELVAKGLLERAPNPDDRRRVDLRLASGGDDNVRQLLPILRNRVHMVFNTLNEAERDTLESLLKRVLSELE